MEHQLRNGKYERILCTIFARSFSVLNIQYLAVRPNRTYANIWAFGFFVETAQITERRPFTFFSFRYFCVHCIRFVYFSNQLLFRNRYVKFANASNALLYVMMMIEWVLYTLTHSEAFSFTMASDRVDGATLGEPRCIATDLPRR